MALPSRYLPLAARFRQQHDGESDATYLAKALENARALPLEAQDRLLDNLMEAYDDDVNDPAEPDDDDE